MGFFLSKLLPQLIYPLGLGLLLQLIAIGGHKRRWALPLSITGWLVIAVPAMPVVSDALLKLSKDISAWSERVQRARAAGAHDLASRAETHLSHLMGQGRAQWQALAALGEEAQQLKQELAAAKQPPKTTTGKAADLEEAWRRFEAEQELDELHQRNK